MGSVGTGVLDHGNMYQWGGDNVTAPGYDMTFCKEGLATFAQTLYGAKTAEHAAGGPTTAAGCLMVIWRLPGAELGMTWP